MAKSEAIGPVQLLVIGFEGNQFSGKILPELRNIDKSGVVRLVDLIVVQKDMQGNIKSVQMSGLSSEEQERFGAIAGGLMGLGAGGLQGARAGAEMGAGRVAERHFGLTAEQVQNIADMIPNNSTAAIVLFGHTWAANLVRQIRDAGGTLIAEGMLTPEALIALGAEVAGVPS